MFKEKEAIELLMKTKFIELFKDLIPMVSIYSSSIFYMKNRKWYLELNTEKADPRVHISYVNIWNIFEKEFRLNDNEIHEFIKQQIETKLGVDNIIIIKAPNEYSSQMEYNLKLTKVVH